MAQPGDIQTDRPQQFILKYELLGRSKVHDYRHMPDGQLIINSLEGTNVFSYPEGKIGTNIYLTNVNWFPNPLNACEVSVRSLLDASATITSTNSATHQSERRHIECISNGGTNREKLSRAREMCSTNQTPEL
jgi:hypothetical protein